MNLLSSDLVSAIFLGIVEGLTEFLPVSSTGHLILTAKALKFSGPSADTFEIFIQLGAILAIVILYFDRFLGLLRFQSKSTNEQRGFEGLQGLLKLAFGCLPAFVFGALLHKPIKQFLFGPYTVAAALIFGGIVMIAVERKPRKTEVSSIDQISYKQCLLVGFFQCFALWPGISRSGATIVGGLLLGMERRTSAEFSFLLAVPIMFAATGFDLLKSYAQLTTTDLPTFAAGFLVSLATAILAVRFFLALLTRFTLAPFGVYRIILGCLVLALLCS